MGCFQPLDYLPLSFNFDRFDFSGFLFAIFMANIKANVEIKFVHNVIASAIQSFIPMSSPLSLLLL